MEGEKRLKAWEQHATVIKMPRFDYQVSSSLSNTSHSGFLITCPIKREKSATKEAIGILNRYFSMSMVTSHDGLGSPTLLQSTNGHTVEADSATLEDECKSETLETSRTKRCRVSEGQCSPNNNKSSHNIQSDSRVLSSETSRHSDDADCLSEQVHETNKLGVKDEPRKLHTENSTALSLVKLTRNGILFFAIPTDCTTSVVTVLESIFQDLESGEIKRPLWCHRFLPVQATCHLKLEDIHSAVTKILREKFGDTPSKSETPLKFAVCYDKRGVEQDLSSNNSILGRNECIQAVAGAVKEVLAHCCVDLQSPEIAVFIEVLPLAGTHTSTVAAVSILPGNLVNSKPRLCVKPIVTDVNGKKKA